ncbi:MAG: hypothetical protein Q8O19_03355, partial [Rectinemataceae bacterium]|nr:hypothetical protein [Rectinemataceae bacterium]
MDERITPHLLKKIRGGSAPVALQFQHVAENVDHDDPLGEEEKFSPVKGLVHKYPNRVLWKVTYRCAAHCQFCTRARQIGSPEGDLVKDDIERALDYLRNHP